MDSRRDVKRTMEKEIKKGSAPILYSGLRFDVDTYHLVENEEKLNHVLDYLFRNGEFANLADKQIRSNIYLDTFMGKMNFRSAKNDLDRRALEATAKRYIMKKQPSFENNVYVENLICCFDIAEEEMKKRIRKLRRALKVMGGFDVLVTHAPLRHYGDREDLPHMGFECFEELLNEYKPKYMLYGHVHERYGDFQREIEHPSGTKLINCCDRMDLEIEPIDYKHTYFSDRYQKKVWEQLM